MLYMHENIYFTVVIKAGVCIKNTIEWLLQFKCRNYFSPYFIIYTESPLIYLH